MGFESLGLTWQILVLTGLSLSLGWGIRGNFGHEIGAAIPGALAAMAAVLMSGRPDWYPRVAYFAMFGALGWSFGGSMSYMHVVSYTHSGHPLSVLYGFANLFVIGFLWAAMGGAGTALPAFLSNEGLALFFVPLAAIFIGWGIKSFVVDLLSHVKPMRRHESRLYWYDTDWLAALVAMIVTLIVVAFRGHLDIATSLILYLTAGWFAAFLLLVNVFKLRMTPPRGDNWSGCLGMVTGLLVFCWRHSLEGVATAALITGFIGGVGFAFAQLLKLVYIKSGLQTNWHSVMEQTQGLFHGIGIAVAMGMLLSRAPEVPDTPLPSWMLIFSVVFILVLLTYLNHRKAVETWVQKVESLPEKLYGIPVSGYPRSLWFRIGWFEMIYIVIGIAVIWLMVAHLRQPLAFVPETWLGKGQFLYMIFLWWVVIFNFEHALVGFTPQRLVTEGVITFNAVICTILMALGVHGILMLEPGYHIVISYTGWIGKTAITGSIVAIFMTLAEWGITHGLYGRNHAPGAGLHIRFGPNATATKEKPKIGQEHP